GSSPLILVFDPATALLAKAMYRVPGPTGEVNVEELYSDYRDVHGLKVAFTTEVRRDGTSALRRTLRTVEFNAPFDPSIFNKPSRSPVRVMIACGEPSGDLYAGALVTELLRLDPTITIVGLGSRRLREAGAALTADFSGLSVTGLLEVSRLLPRTYATYRALVR